MTVMAKGLKIETRTDRWTGKQFYFIDLHRNTGFKIKLFETKQEARNFLNMYNKGNKGE